MIKNNPYKTLEKNSLGRVFKTTKPVGRNEYQRDYARIIHSEAYRRLATKTQVFRTDLSGVFRTRMTHSHEVSELSKSVARVLGVNEDLCAVLAISHDIGHAPFGHLGQEIMNNLFKEIGGFEHNEQALRIVDVLEHPYFAHPGLNLMFETRAGILKHCRHKTAITLGNVAKRHIDKTPASLEAQIVDFCDSIAYLHADIEDAFCMGVINLDLVQTIPNFSEGFDIFSKKEKIKENLNNFLLNKTDWQITTIIKQITREMLGVSFVDLIENSTKNIENAISKNLKLNNFIEFSQEHSIKHQALKAFCQKHIFSHDIIKKQREHYKEKIEFLYNIYIENPKHIPKFKDNNNEFTLEDIRDYLVGMTDKFVFSEYEKFSKNYNIIQIKP